jgi:succinoglycan biosynthesis protein ExoA
VTGPARRATAGEAAPAQAGTRERTWPAVSVVMPVRDEAAHLHASAGAVLSQDYPGPLELVLAIAPSSDGTERLARDLAASDTRVRLVTNPRGGTAAGLNVAIGASTGDVIVRVDGHAEIPPGYVTRAVAVLDDTGADVVGGIQDARGDTPFGHAVAAAMTSRFGVGDAKFHYGGEPGPTDTVYLGVFRRGALDRVGGFDETLVRNQDYELNWRIRESGGVVWFDPALRVRYRPRPSMRSLARQYFEYGQWKREMLRRHPRSLRWRQLVAPAALLANGAGLVLGLALDRRLLAVPGAYLLSTVGAALTAPGTIDPATRLVRLPVAFATMHHAWGAGFLAGPGRRPGARDR